MICISRLDISPAGDYYALYSDSVDGAWSRAYRRFEGQRNYASVKTCQHCKAETQSGALYCAQCGRALAAHIPTPLLAHSVAQGVVASGVPVPLGAGAPARVPSAILLRMTNGQQFILHGQTDYAIGRLGAGRDRPDVDLAAWYGFEGGVSREHIAIHVGGEGVFVKDMDSANETIHNGFRLMPRQWYALGDGDELKLGAIILRVSFQYS